MKTTTRRISTAVALAATIALAPMLTGCAGLEGIIEQATGGEVDVSIGSLPSGWPAEVPVIDGEILFGGTAASDDGEPGWNATIKVENESVFNDISAQLASAGFEQIELGEFDGGDSITSGGFKNANYGVIVAVTGTEGNFVANYTVVAADSFSE